MLVRFLSNHIFSIFLQSGCCENISNPYGFTYVWKPQKPCCITDTFMYQVLYLVALENFYNPATVKQISNPYGFTYVWKLQKPCCITEDISRNISNLQSVAEILKFEITYSSFKEPGIWQTIHLLTCRYMYQVLYLLGWEDLGLCRFCGKVNMRIYGFPTPETNNAYSWLFLGKTTG